MDQKHRDLITKNFSSLVDQTRLEFLVSALYEKEVFSAKMIEPYMDTSKVARDRKCKLYLDIQRRGPQAFDKLIEALQETGHFSIIRILSPEHELSTQFISLKTKPKRNISSVTNVRGESSNPNNSSPLAAPAESVSDKPLKIDVKKSTTFGVSSNPEILCYSMKSRKRGILFMINNIQFKNDIEQLRQGALVDQDNLENLFTQIGFHEKIIHNNKSKKEMNDLLDEFASSSILKNIDCVFIVIASHGMLRGDNETIIITSDGDNMPTNNVLDKFNSKNCPLLHNIPKIFIFQLCRGDSPDLGWKPEPQISQPKMLDYRTQIDGKSENVKMRTYSDMLIAHSTVPGFSSHRDIIHGSWYMISLCKIFMEHAHHSHLEDLFRLVDTHLKDIPLKLGSMQTSSVENRGFNKHCYLNPGLFEET